MSEDGLSLSDRNPQSGYWGRGIHRRHAGNTVFQLHEASAPPEAITPHGHHHAHIVFVTRGPYVTPITGENGFIDRPVAVLNPPGTYHRDHFVSGRGSFMTVDLHRVDLAEDYVTHDTSSRVLQFMNRLGASLPHATDLELEDAASVLSTLFAPRRPIDLADVPPGIQRAYDAIQQSSEPWTLTMAQLAQIADVHENHLPRAFRKRFGLPASHFTTARQMELCAAAIAASDEPLANLAADFGFYDQAHLSTRMRQRIGLSPSCWRAQNRLKS